MSSETVVRRGDRGQASRRPWSGEPSQLVAKDGIAKLLEIAVDQSFPELQAAAATALGETCPGKAKPVLDKLAASPERAVSISAKAARNKCNQLWFPDD